MKSLTLAAMIPLRMLEPLVPSRVAATSETSGAPFRCMKTSAGITAAVPLRQLTSMVLCHLPGDTVEGPWS